MEEIIKKYVLKNTGYSDHIKITKGTMGMFSEIFKRYKENNKRSELLYIDVGGGSGRLKNLADGFKYSVSELYPVNCPYEVVVADICDCPSIQDNTYDIVFSYDVFEHLKEPWKAGKESARILKPGGLVVCFAPFSWRYHPVPIDTFRYSHSGMRSIFEQDKNIKCIHAGYDIAKRRMNVEGFWKNGLDKTLVDRQGGWIENWSTVYIGQKVDYELSDEELQLDSTEDWN
jgi:SAM-dependent methyltransferase